MSSSVATRPTRRFPLPFSPRSFLRCVERRGARWEFFDAREITRIWAHKKYTCFYSATLPRHEQLLDETLQALEARLAPFGFIRVHRKELINLRFLRAVDRRQACACGFVHGRTRPPASCPARGGRRPRSRLVVELTDGQRVPVSRRFAAQLKLALEQLIQPAIPPAPFVLPARAPEC